MQKNSLMAKYFVLHDRDCFNVIFEAFKRFICVFSLMYLLIFLARHYSLLNIYVHLFEFMFSQCLKSINNFYQAPTNEKKNNNKKNIKKIKTVEEIYFLINPRRMLTLICLFLEKS